MDGKKKVSLRLTEKNGDVDMFGNEDGTLLATRKENCNSDIAITGDDSQPADSRYMQD